MYNLDSQNVIDTIKDMFNYNLISDHCPQLIMKFDIIYFFKPQLCVQSKNYSATKVIN